MASGWGWGGLFGGNAANRQDSPKNAILKLRSTLDMLSKRERHLQNQIEEQDGLARKAVATNKNGELARETGSKTMGCSRIMAAGK